VEARNVLHTQEVRGSSPCAPTIPLKTNRIGVQPVGVEPSADRLPSQFIEERKYLKNVTEKTLAWYRDSFKAFEGALDSEASIKRRIMELRQRGVKAVSVNTWLRAVKAYWLWQEKPWAIERLKEEQKIIATLSPAQVLQLTQAKAQTSLNMRRAHLVALTILDTGLRATEVLSLTKVDIDFDNMVVKVVGKGNKHRLVPFSVELRKRLWKFSAARHTPLLFGTETYTKVSVRNIERDFKRLARKLGITGIRFSPHTLRHSFAVMYLRAGGNLEFLRRILGHSSILTTQKYLRSLGVEDLGAVHNNLSPLSARR